MAEESKSFKYTLIGALFATSISALFSGATLFLQTHSEHSFIQENKRLDQKDKRIEQQTHLLDDFVITSNELASLRIKLLISDAHASLGVRMQLGGLDKTQAPHRQNKTPTLQSRALEDPDFNSSVERQQARNLDLQTQILEKNAKLQSIETRASIYFKQNVQDRLQQLHDIPYIISPALEAFKNTSSPERPPSEDITVAFSDRLMDKVLQEAAHDPFKKQSQVVIAAMASEIRQAISNVSN
jgi:hypothetical protein